MCVLSVFVGGFIYRMHVICIDKMHIYVKIARVVSSRMKELNSTEKSVKIYES